MKRLEVFVPIMKSLYIRSWEWMQCKNVIDDVETVALPTLPSLSKFP